MHNVYANAGAAPALKKGGPYPNGSQFVTDLHDFTINEGSYVEGARKGVATMIKDSKRYASTGGWGFQFWAEGDAKKPQVTMPPSSASRAMNRRRTRTTYIRRTSRDCAYLSTAAEVSVLRAA